ncbi:hypothetical protein AA106555_1790 [Neokomagataea thailandica NBRC 106555]|uniref:DUF7673 domain-containing protein n=1 Tax=Neokomagataea thailandica NBRC 106555 TaxID=1223520 RepID=A0ABQ0QS04_9PROT|nr:hypothetical protein [Neokomagataea thailandica]GBR54717.1 hypothetical protein AA106555_1790 [Neokomagataea thailandica NBRC 106555]
MENYNDVLNSFDVLLGKSRGDSRAETVIRDFLVSIWNDRPFDVGRLSALDWQNIDHAKRVLNFWIDRGFCLSSDFTFADELCSLCEFADAGRSSASREQWGSMK